QGLVSYGVYGLACGALLVSSLYVSYRRSVGIKRFFQGIFMRLPIVGRLYVDYSVSIFLQSCGSLIETGSAAGASYAKSAASVPLVPLKRAFESKNADLSRGEQIHKAFKMKAVRA